MGGGASLSMSKSWGPNLHTWIHPIPKLPVFSYLTSDEGPLRDNTFIYFPYCTGDVFPGNLKVRYMPLKSTYHYGHPNVELSLEHLKNSKLINFKAADSVVLFGSSAGAIGSLVHRANIEPYLKPGIKKLLIADSPGLYFAGNF